MKRILSVLVITMAAVCGLQAAQVNVTEARHVAEQFFSARSLRHAPASAQPVMRHAYTAEHERFYVFNRGEQNGFVVVAGDDRLPQVLAYGETGSFVADRLPLGMQDWMAEMNREIAFLQSHSGVATHQPVKRAVPINPLMTTFWDQGWPYNMLCPTYNGGTERAVTGCVATAMAQIMNYHEWPLRGTGSHSYNCDVNDTDPTTLSADFSQSVYEWDKMLDVYNQDSNEESCYAVAKLMSDAGISIDMGYGSSSGASEAAVLTALTRYFGYSSRHYLLDRDLFGSEEWDQLLYDEIGAGRPILYCGYTYTQGSLSGHAFVLDGVDADGLFHVNWGWGGSSDGYFMVSVLAPGSGYNFKFGQDAIFGVVPAHDVDLVPGVLYVRGIMHPDTYTLPRGEKVSVNFSDIYVEGNLMDTAGVDYSGYWPAVYDMIPMELRVFDQNGAIKQTHRFSYKVYISGWGPASPSIEFMPDASLSDGEYEVKIAYSVNRDENYDSWVCDDYGNNVYCKMLLSGDKIYLEDCFLASKYNLESMEADNSIFVGEPFEVDVTLAYPRSWGSQSRPSTTGNIRLQMMKNGEVVATGEPMAVSVPYDATATFRLQMTAPTQWGRYDLMVVDDCGRLFQPASDWADYDKAAGMAKVIVVPKSEELVEDFETMTANSKTNETNVEGRFTSWSFNKSGVRAPGEGKCHGTNSVMMKKPSTFYSVEPLHHNIYMATATFFNNSSSEAKYTLEYSVDNAATWVKALTIDDTEAAVVPATSVTQVIWQLNLKSSEPTLFRIAMTGGGSAATYVDDFILRYNDSIVIGDVNVDGEVNIADVNAVIEIILTDGSISTADVNGDGEVNIADINAILDHILGS